MTKKHFFGLLSVLILAGLILAAAIGSSWFTNKNFKTWFNGWGSGVEKENILSDPNTPDIADNTGVDGAIISGGEDNGIMLMSARVAAEDYEEYGISPQSDSAYLVTATISPSDAADKSVVWSLSWKNPSSSWASGKAVSDYATLTPTTEYGLTATLTVKQGFGEQLSIKAASFLDSTISGTCSVDYLKKMTSFTATLNSSLPAASTGRIYVADTKNTISIIPTYSVGTVEGTITACKTTFTVADITATRVDTLLKNGLGGRGSFNIRKKITVDGLTFTLPFTAFLNGGGDYSIATTILNNYIYKSGANDNTQDNGYDCLVSSVKYDITYSYGSDYSANLTYTYGNGDKAYYFNKKGLSEIPTISSISFDKSNIVVY